MVKRKSKVSTGENYRPIINWCYSRTPWDFQSHIDDLWFWGYLSNPNAHPRRSNLDCWVGEHALHIKKIHEYHISRQRENERGMFGEKGGMRRSYSYHAREAGNKFNHASRLHMEFRKKLDIGSYCSGNKQGSEP